MFLLCFFGHIIANHRIDQANPENSKSKNQITHDSHAVGDSSGDVVEISAVIPPYARNIFGIEALDVNHAKKDVTKTSSDDDDTIDEKFLFRVVFEALTDHTMEGQVGEKRIESE